jgi:hypothetical protein
MFQSFHSLLRLLIEARSRIGKPRSAVLSVDKPCRASLPSVRFDDARWPTECVRVRPGFVHRARQLARLCGFDDFRAMHVADQAGT